MRTTSGTRRGCSSSTLGSTFSSRSSIASTRRARSTSRAFSSSNERRFQPFSGAGARGGGRPNRAPPGTPARDRARRRAGGDRRLPHGGRRPRGGRLPRAPRHPRAHPSPGRGPGPGAGVELKILWLVEEGTLVSPGDRLIEFDPGPFQKELDTARARVRELNGETEGARLAVDS